MTEECSELPSSIDDEILELERQLDNAKRRRTEMTHPGVMIKSSSKARKIYAVDALELTCKGTLDSAAHHFLLLMADSALPLGSFAFSSGLESYLAHVKPSTFTDFLKLSLSSYASTTLPFVIACHEKPFDLLKFDDMLDAAIMCTVGRRASVAQGRALLSIWDRSFKSALPPGCSILGIKELNSYSILLRNASSNLGPTNNDVPFGSAHLGPVFGAITGILGIDLQKAAYIFMLSHVKALLSAAVRASMFGPYQAQKLLASVEIQDLLKQCIDEEWNTKVEDTGQCIPLMDLWIGRHEMLYSRIFNS